MKKESSKCAENCCNKVDNKSNDENQCPWWINSPKHNNCLWIYIREKSAPDGSMDELVQTEIANLLGWSNTKTHFMLKTAMVELIEALKIHKANQLLSNEPDRSSDLNFTDIGDVVPTTREDE